MTNFTWVTFYEAMADCLLGWNSRREELFNKIRNMAAANTLMDYLHFSDAEFWQERDYEIDPFTVMGIFNRGTTDAHRHEMAQKLALLLGLENVEAPKVFHGIPHLDPRKSIYEGNTEMWLLMQAGLAKDEPVKNFQDAWDAAINIDGNGLGILSIGLYWARPFAFMPLDRLSIPLLQNRYGIKMPTEKCSGSEYTDFLEQLRQHLGEETFPSLALQAWQMKHGGNTQAPNADNQS